MNDQSPHVERTTREEVLKEFRVREILEATRRVIGRYGFQGATIDRVAEEAGVAKGTVYLYFTNKDQLLHAAVIEGIREMARQIQEDGRSTGSPLERLMRLVRNEFRILNSQQDFLKALLLEPSFVSPADPEQPRAKEMRQVYMDYLDFVAGLVKEAIEHGQVRKMDERLAAFLLDQLVTGCLKRRLFEPTSTPMDEEADAVLQLLLNGIVAGVDGAGK